MIEGSKTNTDGSHTFNFVGGPYDGCKFRSYPPFEPITFPQQGERAACTYSPTAPCGRYKKWFYQHDKGVN